MGRPKGSKNKPKDETVVKEKVVKPKKDKATHKDCKTSITWLKENGMDAVVKKIRKLEAHWKEKSIKTRRSWKHVLLGTPAGSAMSFSFDGTTVEFPVLRDNKSFVKEVCGGVIPEMKPRAERKKADKPKVEKAEKKVDKPKAEKKAKKEKAAKETAEENRTEGLTKAETKSTIEKIKEELQNDSKDFEKELETSKVDFDSDSADEEEVPDKIQPKKDEEEQEEDEEEEDSPEAPEEEEVEDGAEEDTEEEPKTKRAKKDDKSVMSVLTGEWQTVEQIAEKTGQSPRVVRCDLTLLENRALAVGRSVKDGGTEWKKA